MSFIDELNVTFNGIHLADYGFLSVTVDNSRSNHIFAPSKSVQMVKPIYRTRSIAVGQTAENLTFNLTFSLLDKDFTEKFCELMYQMLDVNTFKPLYFGNDDFYYNAIPFVGSISELNFVTQHKGYITIPFLCDAPHGWIDRKYSFTRKRSNAAVRWEPFNGLGNVRNGDGEFRIYPYLDIYTIDGADAEGGDGTSAAQETAKNRYISFCLAKGSGDGEETVASVTDDEWFSIQNVPPKTHIQIDGENMQFYVYKINNDGTEEKRTDFNILENMYGEEHIFSILSNQKNYLYHRTLIDHEQSSYNWKMDIYASYPIMR